MASKLIPKEDKSKFLLALYEQHLLHARHVENERLWFTNIYAIILAGALSLIHEPSYSAFRIAILVFLLSLSMLGMMLSLKIKLVFVWHTDKAKEIVTNAGFSDYLIDERTPKTIIRRISGSFLFPVFYAFCFSLLCSLLTYTLAEQILHAMIVFAVLTPLFVIAIFYLLKPVFTHLKPKAVE